MTSSNDPMLSPHKHFIHELDQRNVFSSPQIREAFRHIPRHQFLDQIYVKGADGQWNTIPRPSNAVEMDESNWLALVYSDRSLVTRIDQEGIPTCSSSQPSVMAWMLSALDVQPSHHILEVGTGMGYNAGLLAFLTHDPAQVTTIDIDPMLVYDATSRLYTVIGSRIQTRVGNGLEGYSPNAPYDRIIATASYHTVPALLLHQLRPGGILVMNLRGELAGAFLTLQKQEDGTAIGTIKRIPQVSFMAMRSVKFQNSAIAMEFPNLLEHYEIETRVLPPSLFKDHDFLFYLQWTFQRAACYWQSATIGALHSLQPRFVDQSSASLLKWFPSSKPGYQIIEAYGQTSLVQHLIVAYDHFQHLGSPPPERYSLSIDHQGQCKIALGTLKTWDIDG